MLCTEWLISRSRLTHLCPWLCPTHQFHPFQWWEDFSAARSSAGGGPSCTQLFVRSFTRSCVVTDAFSVTGPWTRRTQRCGHCLARADRGGMVPGGGGYTDHRSSLEGGSGRGQGQRKEKGEKVDFLTSPSLLKGSCEENEVRKGAESRRKQILREGEQVAASPARLGGWWGPCFWLLQSPP